MGYGSKAEVTHRIRLADYDGSDEWVDIKARRSIADKEAESFAGVKLSGGKVSLTGDMTADVSDFDFAAVRVVRFQRSIVAWSLKADDADPAPMPLTEDTFRNVLDAELTEWLSDAILRYYEARTLGKASASRLNGSSTALS